MEDRSEGRSEGRTADRLADRMADRLEDRTEGRLADRTGDRLADHSGDPKEVMKGEEGVGWTRFRQERFLPEALEVLLQPVRALLRTQRGSTASAGDRRQAPPTQRPPVLVSAA